MTLHWACHGVGTSMHAICNFRDVGILPTCSHTFHQDFKLLFTHDFSGLSIHSGKEASRLFTIWGIISSIKSKNLSLFDLEERYSTIRFKW